MAEEPQPRESSEKSGIADMDAADRRRTTVEYVPQGPVRLEVGGEYVFMISDPIGDEICAVSAGGYGIFEATTDGYTNHLTGNAFTHDELVAMTAS